MRAILDDRKRRMKSKEEETMCFDEDESLRFLENQARKGGQRKVFGGCLA